MHPSPGALRQAGFAAGSRLSLEEEILPEMHRQGQRFCGFPGEGLFIDIGIPADYQRAQEILP